MKKQIPDFERMDHEHKEACFNFIAGMIEDDKVTFYNFIDQINELHERRIEFTEQLSRLRKKYVE